MDDVFLKKELPAFAVCSGSQSVLIKWTSGVISRSNLEHVGIIDFISN